MTCKRILILIGRKDWLARSMMLTGEADVFPVYRKVHGLTKLIFKLSYRFNIGDKSRWYNPEWSKLVSCYDKIILFDVFDDDDIVKYIRFKVPDSRLIIYYYNIIKRTELLQKLKKIDCEIWSFDRKDCEKYNLFYNPQFYFYKIDFTGDKIREFDYRSDVFFVGKDKKRLAQLKELDEQLRNEGVRTKFIVVGDRKERYTSEQKSYLSDAVSYAECVEYVKNTKCILDIVQMGQKGMTLRIVEAMFFNKKLITNNDDILYMDFYDSKNIYILGYDSRSIKDFILGNPAQWSKFFIHKYSFERWLVNFDDKEV